LPEKLTKFPNFKRLLPKNARLHNKTTRSRPAEAKSLRPTPGPKFWPLASRT